MVVVLSRFRVANGREADVARAFQERPRAVEQVPGFLWLEVFVDRADPALFYLMTRWTDLESFERWHGSDAHRQSHALIPKGLKLDPSFTQRYDLTRLDGTLGPALAEAVADSTLLFAAHAGGSTELHLFLLAPDGTILTCNAAAHRHLAPGGYIDGARLTDYMPAPDAARLQGLLAEPGRRDTPVRLHFAAVNCAPFSLECWVHVHPRGATLLGEPTYRRDQQLQDELMAINQELAVLSRERSREIRSERFAREAAEKLNR
jgi:heme-degrading monooxygenase HmoA